MSHQGLRIAIDGRPALWPRTGVGTITHNVLKIIHSVNPGNRYFAYFDSDPVSLQAEYASVVCSYGGAKNKLLWSNSYLLSRPKRDAVDVFITFLDKEIPFLPSKCKIVSVVHDLIPLRFPKIVFRNPVHRLFYGALIRASIHRSDLVLTNSEFSRREIVAAFGIDERRVCKITLGVDPPHNIDRGQTADVLRRYALTRPFVLALGSTEPRKSNVNVINAVRLLHDAHPNLSLAIAGRNWRGLPFDPSLLDNRVRLLDSGLTAIMASAEMLVFPSLHEGFGFPVLESMALGVPVVTSPVTALPEVAGDAALYADPNNPSDIAEKIASLLSDPSRAATLRHKGIERAKFFRWQSTCSEIGALCAGLVADRQWREEPVAQ